MIKKIIIRKKKKQWKINLLASRVLAAIRKTPHSRRFTVCLVLSKRCFFLFVLPLFFSALSAKTASNVPVIPVVKYGKRSRQSYPKKPLASGLCIFDSKILHAPMQKFRLCEHTVGFFVPSYPMKKPPSHWRTCPVV